MSIQQSCAIIIGTRQINDHTLQVIGRDTVHTRENRATKTIFTM